MSKVINDFLGITHFQSLGYTGDEPICVIEKDNVSEVHKDITNKSCNTKSDPHADKVISTIKSGSSSSNIHFFTNDQNRKMIYEYCLKNNIRIVTESVGYYSHYLWHAEDKWAKDKGIYLVTSAGNGGYTGSFDIRTKEDNFKAIAAVSLNQKGDVEWETYSSVNGYIDYASFVGRKVLFKDRENRIRESYFGGTSEACPSHATLLRYAIPYLRKVLGKEPTLKEIDEFIDKNTIDIFEKGRDCKSGLGIFVLPKFEVLKKPNKNPLAVQMINPSGKIRFVHKDFVDIYIKEEGYKIY